MAGNLPVTVTVQSGRVQVLCDVSALHSPQAHDYLQQHLRLMVDNMYHKTVVREAYHFDVPLNEQAEYHLTLQAHPLLSFTVQAGHVNMVSALWQRLTVMELRMMAQMAGVALPYARIGLSEYANPDYWHSRTDLHTHLTSQISAQDLLEIAAACDAAFPCELLALLGIVISPHPTPLPLGEGAATSAVGKPSPIGRGQGEGIITKNFSIVMIPSIPFSPAASDGLVCEQVGKEVPAVSLAMLRAQAPDAWQRMLEAMHVGVEEIIPFDTLERRIYRLRNPLAKNPALITATIMNIAEVYQRHGVEYAELAVTAALDPAWLEAALPALQEAEKRTGVTLKLLIGLPRAMQPAQILTQLKMVMFVAQHPAIVGVDFLGYEANKTRNFAWALSHFARFASAQRREKDMLGCGWNFADDLIMRVHAGENGKNPDNVEEVLDIALKYQVRVRVGHATYGDAAACIVKAKQLAEHQRIIMEFNPDSNLAMNNIDRAEDLPIVQWAKAGIPYVLASDGAGVYQTDARQLFNAGIFAGLGEEELALMMATEDVHITYQRVLGEAKQRAYHARYGDDVAFIAAMRAYGQQVRGQHIEDVLQGKIPLLIAGASGSSWQRMDSAAQAEIRRGITALVQALDATKVAFVVGRIKPEGLGKVLDDALDAYYAARPDAPIFTVIGMLSGQQNMPSIARHINHIVPLKGELMSVPVQMTELARAHHGLALYIGGSAFTRDFILCSKQAGLPFAVMADVAGASGEKARILEEKHVFHGAEGMVAWVQGMLT
jgi:hypothetical protein